MRVSIKKHWAPFDHKLHFFKIRYINGGHEEGVLKTNGGKFKHVDSRCIEM
jgi:hypothetical protein